MNNWKILFSVSIVFLLLVIVIFAITGLWVVLALAVGFLFGFALQKGDLCGASSMSEIILMKDKNKIFGLWVTIVTGMLLFAIFDALAVIQLNPKKFIWLNALIGGLIFGVGTVLAGGCISGCLYKGASGNINSISALLTIPIGVLLVDNGPLSDLHNYMLKNYVINLDGDKPLTLHGLLNVPYLLLAIIITLLTIFFGYRFIKKQKSSQIKSEEKISLKRVLTKSWKPWQAGIVIGVVGLIAWLVSLPIGRNYPLGVTHGVSYTYLSLIDKNVEFVYKKTEVAKTQPIQSDSLNKVSQAQQLQLTPQNKTQAQPQPKKVQVWLILLVIGVLIGANISARLSGQAKLLPKPPGETLVAMLGGLLVGIGAGFGTGCIVGNIMSGWAMLSLGMIVFGIATLIGNWTTTYFYLMGGTLFKSK